MDNDSARKKPLYTSQQAKLKAQSYCAYQERSQQEVRDKLYAWGVSPADVESVIAELVLDNFLNEERFALAYASGKFRMKGWGKHKIKKGLFHKDVSAPLIAAALTSIDDSIYRDTLRALLEKKAVSLVEDAPYKRKYQLLQYALGKGYEKELVLEILNDNEL